VVTRQRAQNIVYDSATEGSLDDGNNGTNIRVNRRGILLQHIGEFFLIDIENWATVPALAK
jgi:hypothetical protein